METRKGFGIAAAVALAAVAGLALPASPAARAQMQSAGTSATQTTNSYQLELDIEPAMVMLSPDQAQGAMAGEVMVSMPMSGTAMSSSMNMADPQSMSNSMNMGSESMSPSMGMTPSSMADPSSSMMMATRDDGQPVNHHLELHITSKATGSPATDVAPQISIMNNATGQSRMLGGVLAMYDVQAGQSDLHYGNNIYLSDGTYTVTVTVGSDMAQFSNIMVSGGMGLPADSMSMMGNQGTMQPMTGP